MKGLLRLEWNCDKLQCSVRLQQSAGSYVLDDLCRDSGIASVLSKAMTCLVSRVVGPWLAPFHVDVHGDPATLPGRTRAELAHCCSMRQQYIVGAIPRCQLM